MTEMIGGFKSQSLRKSGLWRREVCGEEIAQGDLCSRNPFVNQVFGVEGGKMKRFCEVCGEVAIPS